MDSLTIQLKPAFNKSSFVMSLLMSVSSFITAYLTMFGRYLAPGYKETAVDNNAYAGMQIWDLNQVFAVVSLVIALCLIICIVWPKIFGHPLSLTKALSILLTLIFLAITFFPYPFEFQVRKYASASDVTYILLAQNSADFVDGNESSFAGSQQTKEKLEFYENDDIYKNRSFNCVSKREWWWGKLAVSHSFYPILDKQNYLKLLLANCKEITNE